MLQLTLLFTSGCMTSSRARSPYQIVIPASPSVSPAETAAVPAPVAPAPEHAALPAMIEAPPVATVPPVPTIDPMAAVTGTAMSWSPPTQGGRAPMISLWGDELIEADDRFAEPLDETTNLHQISFGTEGATFDPDVDPSGQLLVFASTRHRSSSDLYLKSVGGNAVTQLTADPGNDMMPAINPGGDLVAFASDRRGSWDIFIMPLEGGPAVQLTDTPEPELHPTWSPDGQTIAFCRFGEQTMRWELWTVAAANPNQPVFLTFGVFPEWSPDITNSKLLFQRARERGSRYHSIWTIDVVDGDARRPTEIVSAANAALINPVWSPDGQKVAFVAVIDPDQGPQPPARSDVWVVNLDGSQRTRISHGEFGHYQPVWSTGERIYFVSDRSGTDNLWSVTTSSFDPLQTQKSMGVVNVDPSAIDSGGSP